MSDIYRVRSEETWAAARADYLGGKTAEAVCRRHDLGLSALRWRARREGWRRGDQADQALIDDDDLSIFEGFETDELVRMARLRMVAAVSRGRATEVLRWKRIHDAFSREIADLDAWFAADAAASEASPQADEATGPPRAAVGELHELHPDFSASPAEPPLSRQQRRFLERQTLKRS